MAPTKKSAQKSGSGAKKSKKSGTGPSNPKGTSGSAGKAAKKSAPSSAPKKAARSAKKAVEPVTRAAGAAKRVAAARGSESANARDAISVLTEDHRRVEELFARFEKTGDGAIKQRQELVERISEALSVHASIEEEIFYPAARGAVADGDDDVLEALEEHHLVKVTLAELETMDPGHERYRAKVTVLIENVRHHVEEEEGELFPRVRAAVDAAELRQLGDQLTAAQRTAPTRPHPEAPDTPPGNLVAQVLTAPLDVAANLNKATARRIRDIVT
jgi:hemerythrin superfamily protein